MPIHETVRKSIIGESAVRIIGSVAGYSLSKPENDYGVDFHVKRIAARGRRLIEAGAVVDIQLKTTSVYEIREGHVIYDLESKTFNDMVQRNVDGDLPLVLVVMTLGESSAASVDVRAEEIAIKRSLYWYMTDAAALSGSEDSSVRIKIPIAQRLDVTTFGELVRSLDA